MGIEKTASMEELRKQYKLLSRKWHPDKNLGNKEMAEKRFKQITHAYEILSDENKRKVYDMSGFEGLKRMEEESHGGGGGMRHNVMQAEPIKIKVSMSLNELYMNTMKEINFKRANLCSTCNGSGTETFIPCKSCNGQGLMQQRTPMGFMQFPCNYCRGSKRDSSSILCKSCRGKNFQVESFNTTVEIPKGSIPSQPVPISEIGHMNSDGSRGPLLIFIEEIPHPIYTRNVQIKSKTGDTVLIPTDISMKLSISFVESIFGFERSLELLNGTKILLSNKEQIKNKDTLVLKGKGMPSSEEEDIYGDLLIEIHIEELPDELRTERLYELLTGKKYVEISHQTHYISYDEYLKEKEEDIQRMHEERQDNHPQCVQQ